MLVELLVAVLAMSSGSAEIAHVAPVAPDIIGITISTGYAEYGEQIPYERQEGDRIIDPELHRFVHRDGKLIGSLVGKNETLLCTMDKAISDPLQVEAAAKPESYKVLSNDDPAYSSGVHPAAVYRKSKPSDLAMVGIYQFEAPVEHVIYLKLSPPLTEGKQYRIALDASLLTSGTALPEEEFAYVPAEFRSEAVHASHLGFRPNDAVKVAFLSCWLGDGGGLAYGEGLPFQVLDTNGQAVFEGETTLSKAADAKDEDEHKKNYSGTDVYQMDFSALKAPGTYRVCVAGVGCSYPFEIAEDAWKKAFIVAARGLLHQRSGIPLGPPYTDFERPRPFHADDGVEIFESLVPLMDTGNGLGGEPTNFGRINEAKTDKIVPDAWGGYMDAGDWDRRIQHLKSTMLLFELLELFPEYFDAVGLNIPESGNTLPDVIDEGLFNLDCYRRMQTAEGGIRGGIESSEHPRRGEGSWQESLDVMAYEPGVFSSYFYAGVAARAAGILETRDKTLAQTYRESALKAMEWAENDLPRSEKEDHNGKHPAVRDARNYAAAELYRLTGDTRWNTLFLDTTDFKEGPQPFRAHWDSLHQGDSAWVYVRTAHPGVDKAVQEHCRKAIVDEADLRVASIAHTGFKFSKHPYAPIIFGALSSPEESVTTVRAHILSGDAKYLAAIVLACQTSGGANPVNMCYTTGLGHKSPLHPLNIDSRYTHQPPPAGLTVGGPLDGQFTDDIFIKQFGAQYCHPDYKEWPVMEAFWDVFWDPLVCEYTVHKPMAGTAYVWGYLAARK